MKTPTRFIKALSQEQRSALNHLMRNHPSYRTRTRAHAILLSARRYSINQIADIFSVDRETVTTWLARWEESETDGLDEALLQELPVSYNPPFSSAITHWESYS